LSDSIDYTKAVFSHGVNVASDDGKTACSFFASKTTRDFLFYFHHPYSLFGQVITEGHSKVSDKANNIVTMVFKTL
jgi:hypothetical protein